MDSSSNETKSKNGRRIGYLVVLFVILTAIYIVDEISSNITTSMQPYVILDLFDVPGGSVLSDEYASAVGLFTTMSMVCYGKKKCLFPILSSSNRRSCNICIRYTIWMESDCNRYWLGNVHRNPVVYN